MGDGRFVKGMIPWNKKEHIIKHCKYCGKEFDVKPSLNRVQHCSYSCAKKGKTPRLGTTASFESREKMSFSHIGEKNVRWKGGAKRRCSHYTKTFRYKNWRMAVFTRDKFVCQGCGETHIYITAHHIKSWTKFPDLRYELNNGLTLCEECHSKTDNYKGRGKKCLF